MNDLTLVVMAAGMGSRFGGLKQITPVDLDGNFIIDYSVFDAIRAGFKKVVFVIKEENYDDFKETIGKRLEGVIPVSYAIQNISDVPYDDMKVLSKRVKPWGTVQAVLAAKDYVLGNFAVINADDFYGFLAFKQVANFFKENNGSGHYVAIPYRFCDTASNNGAVKRGVCTIKDGLVTDIIECSLIEENGAVRATPLSGDSEFTIDRNDLVSMNMFGFTNDFFGILECYMNDYFKQDVETILNNEVLLPECLRKYLKSGEIVLNSYPSNSKWLGMTYKEDLVIVKDELSKMRNDGLYPDHLWNV